MVRRYARSGLWRRIARWATPSDPRFEATTIRGHLEKATSCVCFVCVAERCRARRMRVPLHGRSEPAPLHQRDRNPTDLCAHNMSDRGAINSALDGTASSTNRYDDMSYATGA
jgi:hypothetical protein